MISLQCKLKRISLSLSVLAVVISSSICCEELEWSCGGGECLAMERICDGKIDCPDKSDETSDICNQQVCPAFAFRCVYGACVPERARCNKTVECADGSDEDPTLCGTEVHIESTSCLEDQFRCNSTECIAMDEACDGRANCPDQSDESVEICASILCPAIFFRCGYGACIKSNKKCDNVVDCLDGSDESLDLCKNNPGWIAQTSKPQVPLVTSTEAPLSTPKPVSPTTTTTPRTSSKLSCIAPNIKNSRLVYESEPSRVIEPGDEVPNFISIMYKCLAGYNREGSETNICWNGAWFSKIEPICTRYCPHEILNSYTFTAKCLRDGVTVPCNNRIKLGTMASISCSTKYRIPDQIHPTQTIFCGEDGQWDYPPSRCYPVCGEELLPSVPFLTNGQVTDITTVPWHVGIYRNLDGRYKHHCGGSIINAKVIISAAHCFWDNANENIYDKSMYIVGAGKYYRDYYSDESRKAQFQNISKIAVPSTEPRRFKGADANYQADIAVIVLVNAFVLSEYISPICIQWERDGAKAFANNTNGQVAGWGQDESGTYSQELKTIYVPGSSYESCRIEAGRFKDSITDDKFCVLNRFNQNACQGDSGGGFAVKKEIGYKSRFYLWGVVSTGVPLELTCTNYQFVSYTNIQYFESFVTSLEAGNRPR